MLLLGTLAGTDCVWVRVRARWDLLLACWASVWGGAVCSEQTRVRCLWHGGHHGAGVSSVLLLALPHDCRLRVTNSRSRIHGLGSCSYRVPSYIHRR